MHRCNSAATQICCNYPWSPKGRKNIHRGDQRKFFEKKNWKIFFYKTFFNEKNPRKYIISIQENKIQKIAFKKNFNLKIAENELFWFYGRFLAFWAQKWPKIGPKIGPNNKFELWVPKRVHRRGLTPFLKNADFFLPIPNRFKHCAMIGEKHRQLRYERKDQNYFRAWNRFYNTFWILRSNDFTLKRTISYSRFRFAFKIVQQEKRYSILKIWTTSLHQIKTSSIWLPWRRLD